MRLKCFILSILLISGMDLFGQETESVYPIFDFAIRNAVTECFNALRDGDAQVLDMFLSEPAAEAGSDFPPAVRSMLKIARAEAVSAQNLSPIRPYVRYEYRYLTHNDISYVIGIAVAEYRNQKPSAGSALTARPFYLVYTDKGWKVFWIGTSWMLARFAEKDMLVVVDTDNKEVSVSIKVETQRDEFYSQLVGVSMPKKQSTVQTPSQLQKQAKPQQQAQSRPSSDRQSGVDTVLTKAPMDPVSYETATVKPTFGGRDASTFADWVRRHIRYPEAARKQDLEGTTKIKFVIDTLGNVTSVRVVESAGKRTKAEFDDQVKLASFIANQYKDQLDKLMEKSSSLSEISEKRKLYEEAQQYLLRLKRLQQNRNYVLPEYVVLDNEAVRVVKSSPQWEAGEYRYRPVPVEYTVSVRMKP